ncbi:MAG: cyanophycin synthetase [Bacillota bacterium]
MRLIRIRAFGGRNLHSHRPVVEMVIDIGEFVDRPTNKISGFTERLVQALPQLRSHHCSLGRPGGFLKRLQEGTLLGHVVEHVALEIQAMAGMPTRYGKTRQIAPPSTYQVVFEYTAREAAMFIGEAAVKMVADLARGKACPVDMVVKKAQRIAAITELGPSTAAIAMAAEARDIPVMRLDGQSLLQLGYGKYAKRVEATITQNTSCVGVDLCRDKALSKRLLADAGLPVPPGDLALSEHEALEVAKAIGCPVAVKPLDGNQGRGVTLNLQEEAEIRSAYNLASRFNRKVLVEKYVDGNHYRALVVGHRVVACSQRLPAHVTGDGVHTLKQLIQIANEDPLRGEGHEKPLTKIRVDPVVLMVLARQKKGLGYTPALGELVYLRENANLSTGGIALDATDDLHPHNAWIMLRAVQAMGLDVAGVDFVAQDVKKPLEECGGAIIEVNAAPGLRMHLHPWAGKSRDVASDIVEHLFPPGSRSRIPIAAVTGTNGKTTTCRLISYIAGIEGYNVGMAITDGVYLGGRRLLAGDNAGPWSARLVLRDPSCEMAVLETARGGIIHGGLAFDWCDVAVVTNVASDHLGLDGIETLEDLAWVKGLVAESARSQGFVVLNADDPSCVTMAMRIRATPVYFSIQPDNLTVKRHTAQGHTALFLRDGVIVVGEKGKEWNLIRLKEVPCTLQGMAKHNVENCLSAAGAVLAMGFPPYVIRKGLCTFTCDDHLNPGRFNLIAVGDFRVLLDYGHNSHALETVLPTARQMATGRLIGVVTCPGDRRNEDIEAVGAASARHCHRVVFKEDTDLRGRQAGEIARLLVRGARSEGMALECIDVVPDEGQAVRRGLVLAGAGDVVAVFYEKYSVAMWAIESVRTAITDARKDRPVAIF